jgi:hypothetical protein
LKNATDVELAEVDYHKPVLQAMAIISIDIR